MIGCLGTSVASPHIGNITEGLSVGRMISCTAHFNRMLGLRLPMQKRGPCSDETGIEVEVAVTGLSARILAAVA